jgi:hypothetical protein
MVCFDTARNKHNTCNCPIMKNLGFKIEKRSPLDNPCKAASQVVTEVPSTPAPAPAPTPAPPPLGDSQPGFVVVPGAFSAVTETTYYNSGDEFDYEGKLDGAMYVGNSKHTSFTYLLASCSHTSLDHAHTDLPGQMVEGLIQDKWGSSHFQQSICVTHSLRSSRSQYGIPPKDSSLPAGQSSHTVLRTHTEAVFHAHAPRGGRYRSH